MMNVRMAIICQETVVLIHVELKKGFYARKNSLLFVSQNVGMGFKLQMKNAMIQIRMRMMDVVQLVKFQTVLR